MNASYAEKDARRRVQMAEEKAELVSELSSRLSYSMLQINTKLTLVFFKQGSLRRLCGELKRQMEYGDAGDPVTYSDENEAIRNYDENIQPFPAINSAYEYRTAGPKSRGPTPGFPSGKRRTDDVAKQAQVHMQEAASLAAFNVLQSQVSSNLFWCMYNCAFKDINFIMYFNS